MKVSKPILCLIFCLTACDQKQDKDKDKEENAPVPVEVVWASRGDISSYLLSTTNIDSESKVDVYPKHDGPVIVVRAEEGDVVQPGQLLAQIDPSEYELRSKQASTSFEELKAAHTRLQQMYKNKMTSLEAYEAAKFAFDKAQIAMDMARLELDNTRILSPIRGTVIARGVRFGERVTPATLAYSIMDMGSRIAEAHLPENEIARIRPGLPVQIATDALPGRSFSGKVRKISPAIDPRSGTAKVTIDLEDPELLLRPGMFVRVNIVLDTHRGVVLLPRASVVNVDNQLAVFVVRPAPPATHTPAPDPPSPTAPAAPAPEKPSGPVEVVERVFFQVGYQDENFVEAVSGVEEGERLVHIGQQGLQSGAQVLVMNRRAPE